MPQEIPLNGCAMCGRLNPKYQSEREDAAYKGRFCHADCANNYWSLHHSDKEIRCEYVQNGWSFAAKCTLLSKLLFPEPISKPSVVPETPFIADEPGALPASRTEEEFTRYFGALDTLKTQLCKLREHIQSSKATNAIGTSTSEWIAHFDDMMSDLDVLCSDNFSEHFLKRIVELQQIREACRANHSQHTELAQGLEQIKGILAMMVKRMPHNRYLYNNRAIIKKMLGMDRYAVEKMVLTLDGGGTKGIVTLVVIERLLRLIRRKTNNNQIAINDIFDLVIGTSTGGVIAGAMIILGMETGQVEKLYQELGAQVFSETNKTEGLRFPFLGGRYADWPMFVHLRNLFGTRRLDDVQTAYTKDGKITRVGFVTASMDGNRRRPILLRNYEKFFHGGIEVLTPENAPLADGRDSDKPREVGEGRRTEGTNECYVLEAIRATSAAPTIVHPLARNYAPVETDPHKYRRSIIDGYTRYKRDRRTKAPYSHGRLYVEMWPKEQQGEATARQAKDVFMQKAVLMDGGVVANNSVLIGLTEAQHIWADEEDYGIRIVSLGTGDLPYEANKSWNADNPTPVTQGVGKVKQSFADEIIHALVIPACDTTEADEIMRRFGTLLASYDRINPPLGRAVPLDDAQPSTMRELRGYAEKWCDSKQGQETLERIADDIVLNSSRLHARIHPKETRIP